MIIEQIPESNLVHGHVYRIRCRNLVVGVWDSSVRGFIGIREKFHDLYLFTEYHHDTGPPYGTAHAIGDLTVDVPDDIEVEEGRSNGERFISNKALFEWLLPYDEQVSKELAAQRAIENAEYESRRWRPQTEREHFEEQQSVTRRTLLNQERAVDSDWHRHVERMRERIRADIAEANERFGPRRESDR